MYFSFIEVKSFNDAIITVSKHYSMCTDCIRNHSLDLLGNQRDGNKLTERKREREEILYIIRKSNRAFMVAAATPTTTKIKFFITALYMSLFVVFNNVMYRNYM